MPSVRNLTPTAPVAAATPFVPATPTNAVPAPTVLPAPLVPAEPRGLMHPAKPPAWMTSIPSALAMPSDSLPAEGGANYVAVFEANATAAVDLRAAGVPVGSIYLRHDGTRYRPLNPLVAWTVGAAQYYSEFDNSGNLVKAKTVAAKGPGDDALKRHFLLFLLVDLGDAIVPAKAEFKGTKEALGAACVRGVQLAASPEWPELSDNHKISAMFSEPWGRAVVQGSTAQKMSKSSGNRYFTAMGDIHPATVSQMERLVEFLNDPAQQAACRAVETTFTERLNLLRHLAGE